MQTEPSPLSDGQAAWCHQVSDGAAATLLMTRREALRRGLPILGIFRGFSAVGVDPAVMGIGAWLPPCTFFRNDSLNVLQRVPQCVLSSKINVLLLCLALLHL